MREPSASCRRETASAVPGKDLSDALGLRAREHVAIVGGGGKTSLMLALADELTRRGCRVVATTTTRVRHEEAGRFPAVMISEAGTAWPWRVRELLGECGRVFLGERILPSGKVEGISPATADKLFMDGAADHVIVEADGSAGRPVKAPAAHEPVVPESATLVVAVMGLEAMGRRFNSETVFRPEEVQRITRAVPGCVLTPEILSMLFQAPGGLFKGAPETAGRVAFLNKLDLIEDRSQASALVEMLAGRPGGSAHRVVAGSLILGDYPIVRINA